MSHHSDSTHDDRPESAIENSFPSRAVNRLASTEVYNKHHYRPTNYQHKWWAKRLGSVFRTLCLAALGGPQKTSADLWADYLQPNDVGDAVVFDPFMGAGTTGQEATRLGAKFIGGDINPVAWFVSRMALAPHSPKLEAAYERVLADTREVVRPYYRTRCPDCGEETAAEFYLWVEVVDDAPGDSAESEWVREYDSLVVNHAADGGATVVCPVGHAVSTVTDPTAATCKACGTAFDATREDVRVPVREPAIVFGGKDRPTYEPYAVKYDCDCGEGFTQFDAFDTERFRAAREELAAVRSDLPLPLQAIPEGGEKTSDLRNRGYTAWTQLFNARQLLTLGTLLDEIMAVEAPTARHYLTLTFSAALEFNNMFCSYKGSNPRNPGAVRHVFSHHAFVHPSEPLENNPFGTRPRQSGTVRNLYEYRLQRGLKFQHTPVERVIGEDGTVAEKRSLTDEQIGGAPADSIDGLLDGDRTHYLYCGDSASIPTTDVDVDAVITDPPYFDSVQYGELADFFYVWLKQALEADFPEAFAAETVVSSAEVVGNHPRAKSMREYQARLGDVFETCRAVLKPDGPLVFTFHHKNPDAWGAVLAALNQAGFRVVRTYPVRGENRLSVHINGQRAIQLDCVIVCRPGRSSGSSRWTTLAESIRATARDRLRDYHHADEGPLSSLDASVVVRGVCMAEYSAHERVIDTDGTALSEREALRRVEAITTELNDEAFS